MDIYSKKKMLLNGRNLSFEELKYDSDGLSFNRLDGWLSDRLKVSQVDENILKSLDLIKDGSYNNAAALIADRNSFPGNGLDLIRYGDRKMTQIIDRVSCDGVSVIEQFERAMAFYEKHINQGEVPFVAYRETVANAIVHRDYMRNGRNRIEIFNDRIEVMSIGGLPVGISEDEYLRGSFSNMRNRISADVFYRCGYIERLGTGIRRIREAYMDFEEKPIFQIYQNSIITTLPKQSQIILRESAEIPYGYLTADEDRAYNFILATEEANRVQLETYMDIKKTKAGEILKSLVDKGVVMAKGSGRAMKYVARK